MSGEDRCHPRAKLTESLKLHDQRLLSDSLQERSLRMRPSHRALRTGPAEDCSDWLSSRVLDDEEHRGEDDAQQQTDNKVESARRRLAS
jgi:hypothetical protein